MEAARRIGKKGKFIPPSHVDMTEYSSEPPYCTYYPDATVEGSNGPDALWMLSGLNTGECSKQRECLCRRGDPGDSSGSVVIIVVPVVVGAAVILVGVLTYVLWQKKKKQQMRPTLADAAVPTAVRTASTAVPAATDQGEHEAKKAEAMEHI